MCVFAYLFETIIRFKTSAEGPTKNHVGLEGNYLYLYTIFWLCRLYNIIVITKIIHVSANYKRFVLYKWRAYY